MSTQTTWKLLDLLQAAGVTQVPFGINADLTGITDDSRQVRPGFVFVARSGVDVDGHDYVPQAVRKGAVAVLVEHDVPVPAGALKVRVPSTQVLLGQLLDLWYGQPSQAVTTVGVTGTNGKTSVTWWLHALLELCEQPAGLLGTIVNAAGEQSETSTQTTPPPQKVHNFLHQLRDQNMNNAVMEVSSHAMDQARVAGVSFAGAVLTNITPEHLDYHGSMENYANAKISLFEMLSAEAWAILNVHSEFKERIAQKTAARVVTYGVETEADYVAKEVQLALDGTSFILEAYGESFPVCLPFVGVHNIENALAVIAAARNMGISLKRIVQEMPHLPPVPGRLEPVDCGQPFKVFVDYAHTADALERVLSQLRRVADAKILTVFGCGGDRDKSKRPLMGQSAAKHSDRVIVTSDNPRTEDPSQITEDIVAGMSGSTPWEVILDRKEAIETAVEIAQEGWLVLLAGKGHETGQQIGERTVPFHDKSVLEAALGARFGGQVA